MTQEPTFVILCSGRGSNMLAILDACEKGHITATPTGVISNNSNSLALEKAKARQIPSFSLNEDSPASRDISLKEVILKLNPDFIILAGYLKKLPSDIIEHYPDKILNIHPALLPEFGGKGMYGLNVHEAVIEAGKNVTGVTIHYVTGEYDKGAILFQAKVPVLKNDTPESLAARVLEIEHQKYPEVIEEFIQNSLRKNNLKNTS